MAGSEVPSDLMTRLWAGISAADRRKIEADPHPWLAYLIFRIGEREISGKRHNPLILAFGEATDAGWKITTDEIYWCATAVNGALVATGYPTTHSAMARSFMSYGTRQSRPERGDIVVFPRGEDPNAGHVGIVETVHKNGTITVVNGNVQNSIRRTVYRIDSVLPGGIRRPPSQGESFVPHATGKLGDRPLLVRGDAGPDVEELQQRLARLGYMENDAEIDVFWLETEKAVRRFQKDQGIKVDGKVGTATISALLKAKEVKVERKERNTARAEGAIGTGAGALGAGGIIVATGTAREVTEAARGFGDAAQTGGLFFLGAILLVAVGIGVWFLMRQRSAEA